MTTKRSTTVVWLVTALLLAGALRAEAAAASGDEQSDTELAKKTQNPVADLISVPFQNNFYFNTGPEKQTVWDPEHRAGDPDPPDG